MTDIFLITNALKPVVTVSRFDSVVSRIISENRLISNGQRSNIISNM